MPAVGRDTMAVLRHHLLNLLTAVSLLLCIAACALWVRSYWRYDLVVSGRSTIATELHSIRGNLMWMSRTPRQSEAR